MNENNHNFIIYDLYDNFINHMYIFNVRCNALKVTISDWCHPYILKEWHSMKYSFKSLAHLPTYTLYQNLITKKCYLKILKHMSGELVW